MTIPQLEPESNIAPFPGFEQPQPPDATPYEPVPFIEPSDTQVIPLGYDRGVYFYYSTATRQVTALKPPDHTRPHFSGIASAAHYWEPRYPEFQSKTGFNWSALADHMMERCRDRGIYDPSRLRGRGAWVDICGPLLHIGENLIIDGKITDLVVPESKYIYEAAPRLIDNIADPLDNKTAHWLIRVCELLRWERKASGRLLAGWIAIAPICGALQWRPSIWVTAAATAGKSWVFQQIILASLQKFSLPVLSKTTEAGIREAIGCDAIPVIFDEAEREDAASAIRMQAVLDLMRQSSSETSASIIKGTGNVSGPKRYRVRSCFAFQSINVSLLHHADESRVTVLALRDHSISTDIAFADLELTVRERITPEFSAGLIARSVSLIPQIRENAETFARAIAVGLGSRRLGDQLGTLLAGAYSLHSTGLISAEDAASYIAREDWAEESPHDDEKDEYRCLQHLMTCRVRLDHGEVPVSRLIESYLCTDIERPIGLVSAAAADQALRDIGLRISTRSRSDSREGLFVAVNYPPLRRALAGTPWDVSYWASLARLPGAESGRGVEARFARGLRNMRATWLPISILAGDGGD